MKSEAALVMLAPPMIAVDALLSSCLVLAGARTYDFFVFNPVVLVLLAALVEVIVADLFITKSCEGAQVSL